MKNRSAASLKSLMEDKIADLNLRIAHLQAVRTTLVFFIHNIFSFSIYGLDRTVTVWFIIRYTGRNDKVIGGKIYGKSKRI